MRFIKALGYSLLIMLLVLITITAYTGFMLLATHLAGIIGLSILIMLTFLVILTLLTYLYM